MRAIFQKIKIFLYTMCSKESSVSFSIDGERDIIKLGLKSTSHGSARSRLFQKCFGLFCSFSTFDFSCDPCLLEAVGSPIFPTIRKLSAQYSANFSTKCHISTAHQHLNMNSLSNVLVLNANFLENLEML